jgi:hypothetical protein
MTFEDKVQDIKKRTARLQQTVGTFSSQFYKSLIDSLSNQFDVVEGKIAYNQKNLAVIAQIDRLYQRFTEATVAPAMTKQINDGVQSIAKFNTDYFSEFGSGSEYERTRTKVQGLINDRLGLGEKTKLKPGGFVDNLMKDNSIRTQLKNFTIQEVVKGVGFKDFKYGLEKMIVGDRDRLGAFERYHRQYTYDVFVQVDRSESALMAKELNLKYFIYAGTVIDTSRTFCEKRAGEVFTVDEAQKWEDDPWIKNAFKKGYITTYDPVQDLGLWGCRHIAKFISKEAAEKLRPDLKGLAPVDPKPKPPEPKKEPKPKAPPKPKQELPKIDPPVPPEVPKVPIMPKPEVPENTFVPAKTLKEAEAFAIKTIGVKNAGYKGVDVDIANQMNEVALSMKTNFPEYQMNFIGSRQERDKLVKAELMKNLEASGYIKKIYDLYGARPAKTFLQSQVNMIVPRVGPNVIATSHNQRDYDVKGVTFNVSNYNGITINAAGGKKGKSGADYDKLVENGVKSSWFVKGSGKFNQIVHHEMGHEIDALVGIKSNDEFMKIFNRERAEGVSKLTEKLSKYGATAGGKSAHLRDEMIAEAWAEFMTSDNPRPLAKEIGTLIQKLYKEKFKK